MSSEPMRDPVVDPLLTPQNAMLVVIDYQPTQVNSIRSMDHQALVDNIVTVAKTAKAYGLPIGHSTGNVKTGVNKPPIQPLLDALGNSDFYDRTQINAWEDVEFRKGIEATGRRKLIMTALWTEACLTFPTIDAIRSGFEVYPVVDAVGGTSMLAHETGLRRGEQGGGPLTRNPPPPCGLPRGRARASTRP